MVERWFVKPRVEGSNPSRIANNFVAQQVRASRFFNRESQRFVPIAIGIRNYKLNKRFRSATGQSIPIYNREGYRFEMRSIHEYKKSNNGRMNNPIEVTSFLERKTGSLVQWLTFPTVSREQRVRFPYEPQMVFLVYQVKPRAVNPKNRVRSPKTPKK